MFADEFAEWVDQKIDAEGALKALAERWRVSEGTIRGWRDKGASPTLRMLADIRFSDVEVMELLRLLAAGRARIEPRCDSQALQATASDALALVCKLNTDQSLLQQDQFEALRDGFISPDEHAALDIRLDQVICDAEALRPSRFRQLLRAGAGVVSRISRPRPSILQST